MAKKTIEVDSDMIDRSTEELAKLILRLGKNPKKLERNKTLLKKFKRFEIRYRTRSSMRN